MFIDRHKQSDIIKDYKNFSKKFEKLKLYMIEFEKDDVIKEKIYLFDYIVKGEKQWPIIIIIYNKYLFFANNSIYKV